MKLALLGSAVIGAALLCGPVQAQSYGDDTVTVQPDTYFQKRTLAGKVNGEANPTEFRLSREITFSSDTNRGLLHDQIRDAARDLCFELNARFPELRDSPSDTRECVRKATMNAMIEVRDRFG